MVVIFLVQLTEADADSDNDAADHDLGEAVRPPVIYAHTDHAGGSDQSIDLASQRHPANASTTLTA